MRKKNIKIFKRIVYFSVGSVVVATIFGLFLWNNASLEFEGKRVTLKESIYKVLRSEQVNQLTEVFKMIWNFYKAHGFKRLVNNFYYGYDPEALANAYKVFFILQFNFNI